MLKSKFLTIFNWNLVSIGGLPLWASILIVCGAGGGGLGILSILFCVFRRKIRARRRYRRFDINGSQDSLDNI